MIHIRQALHVLGPRVCVCVCVCVYVCRVLPGDKLLVSAVFTPQLVSPAL